MRFLTMLAIGLATFSTEAAAQQTRPQPPLRLPVTRVIGDTMKLVIVQNDRSTPVAIFWEAGGIDRRLGVVAAGAVATLQFPAWAVNDRKGVRSVRLGEVPNHAGHAFVPKGPHARRRDPRVCAPGWRHRLGHARAAPENGRSPRGGNRVLGDHSYAKEIPTRRSSGGS